MDFSPDTIRARFHELTAKFEALDAKLAPLRAELDSLADSNELTAKEAHKRELVLRPKIKALMAEQFPLEAERAVCARALGGKTGHPA